MKRRKLLLIVLLIGYATLVNAQKANNSHPRIYNSDASKSAAIASFANVSWKKDFIERKKQEVAKYIQLCEQDSTWLVSRLQMNWKTKHSNVYLKGGDFSHSDGEAPVPTVRYSGTRDWATDYKKPALEEVEPYFDDERGYYLENKNTGKKEWIHPSETGHIIEGINQRVLGIVEDAAFLYWLTGEAQYAQLATPVFFTYINGMHHRNPPEVLDESNQRFISGLATFEVIHEKAVQQLVISYDYLYNYFVDQQHDLSNTAAVFQKWGDQIIKYGIPDNNWNLFQARFLTYIALALENDDHYENGKGQQYYLKYTFDESTPRQIAIKEALLVYDQETGIWPESPAYSMHVNTTLLEILALLDNVTNTNELANFPIIEKAALACFQYLFPSGYTVGFGDGGHKTIPFENLELLIANYQKYHKQEQAQLITSLLQPFIEDGIYKRNVKNLLQLNFYVDELPNISSTEKGGVSQLTTPTFYAPNVSMFIQRLGAGDKAMMVSMVGSYGNHTHANGISMELFANNYVLAPDKGKGKSYWSPDFKEYYSQMPAHNTVVVDGKSTYPNMRSYNPFSLDYHFPKSGVLNPLFTKVAYGNFSFIEPKTHASQQRLTAMINTPSGEGYVLDIFRSKKQQEGEQKHDYFYHNLGHALELYDADDQPLSLEKTKELTSQNGELKAYDYLTEKHAVSMSGDAKAVFKIEENTQPDNVMQVWIKGHENQTLFAVKSPKSNALEKGTAPESLIDKEMPTLILRRKEAAWNEPYVLVFNPYLEGNNPIKQVDFRAIPENPNGQKITVQHTDGITYDHIAAATSANDVLTEEDLYQKGLLSVTRTKEDASEIDFLFASGMYQLKYKEWEILAIRTAATVSVEKQAEGFWVQNDVPVIIKAPITADFTPAIIHLYNEDGTKIERRGNINRSNSNQIEFRLTKAYQKAVIISEQSNGK
ncbi:heparinase II/III domain-containing protein [Flexithrix dorotheae]|uniref:heparinase II/III domain-containing protein n=1 Tax=Flexithrix dorotheae TaxID=70993 RepID=UPI0005C5C089|nr:heparinase II/III family protein [Flexithrix dorotheae]